MLWRRVLLALAAGVVVGGCSAAAASGPTVLVDYSHDQFASQFMAYFPSRIQVYPGDTVTFKQTWTGEPHTVTFGVPIGEKLAITNDLLDQYGHLPESEVPPDAMEQYLTALQSLPSAESEDGNLAQAIAQPCVVDDGPLPTDPGPCEQRDLPAFTGTETFYNSGVIPFEGRGENRFDLVLSEDIEPGSYLFYCIIHGPFQSGALEVVATDEPVPTAREIGVEAREEISEAAGPMAEYVERARDDGVLVLAGQQHEANFAGLLTESSGVATGQVNEFLPADVTVTAGEPINWQMFGAHSIAFDVPEYFPIIEFAEDGEVTYNNAVNEPAGGAPALPATDQPPQPGPLMVDGGTWDGSGFYSSGTLYSEDYVDFTMRISAPGTYPYACLIHPPMIGTVTVTP